MNNDGVDCYSYCYDPSILLPTDCTGSTAEGTRRKDWRKKITREEMGGRRRGKS
jgi:hypothetical protein